MQPRHEPSLTRQAPEAAFTLTELAVVLATIALLAVLVLPVLSRGSDGSERALCADNMKHLMAATAMYASDNGDVLPHPSWGSIPAGADNWCYATSVPGLGPIPDAAGIQTPPIAYTGQLPWFRAGQLAKFLPNQSTTFCPNDVRESVGAKRNLWRDRQQKLTSYSMSGEVFVVPNDSSTSPQKSSLFRPDAIVSWDTDELRPFNFNDAGNNPSSMDERASARHEGGSFVGSVGGAAEFMITARFSQLANSPRPNRVLCAPQ